MSSRAFVPIIIVCVVLLIGFAAAIGASLNDSLFGSSIRRASRSVRSRRYRIAASSSGIVAIRADAINHRLTIPHRVAKRLPVRPIRRHGGQQIRHELLEPLRPLAVPALPQGQRDGDFGAVADLTCALGGAEYGVDRRQQQIR